MKTPKELIERRAEVMSEIKELTGKITEEKRAFTDEESAKLEELRGEYTALGDSIQKITSANEALEEKGEEKRAADAGMRSDKDILVSYIRGGVSELRDNETKLVNSNSIKLSDFSADIVKKMKDLCGIIQRITLVNARGDYKQIVEDDDYKAHGAWTAEGAQITAAESRWKTITIPHFKYPSLSIITLEMLNQAAFDPLPEISNQESLDFAYAVETGIIKGAGDGSGQPTGLVTSGTTFNTASSAAISADEIIDIYHSLKSYYTMGAAWLMNNKTLSMIRKLKDSTGNYLFRQTDNLTEGYTGFILGKPVLVSECMPDVEAGAKPILYGDFARAYKGVMDPAISFQVLREKYADIGAVGVQGMLWFGGKPINAEAYTTVTMPE